MTGERTGADVTAPLRDSSGTQWKAGQAVDRYVVLRRIGEGGCGEVLAAFDPVLDRNVAIKLLRGEGSRITALLREARTLARLDHPNIVTIHDAGVMGDQPFLAMELVAGSDLRTWLGGQPPPTWRETFEILRQAGAGLAAAHERGIVHGDVKPANILVGDGRARVTDFGVAVWEAGQSDRTEPDTAQPGAFKLVGTPAYMAPEQYRGATPDARSDQYAFCQTAWEAMFGGPAFGPRSSVEYTEGEEPQAARSAATGRGGLSVGEIAALADAKSESPPLPPAGTKVPRRVIDALLRGLEPQPEARWPSMADLLRALAYDPWKRRRFIALGVGTIGLAVAASVSTAAWVAPEPPCRGAGAALGELAGPRLDAVDAALGGDAPSYAEATRRYVAQALREHADEWQTMHTEACEATSVRGEQSEEVLDLRMACLANARERFDAATWVLVDGGTDVLPRAHQIVGGLAHLKGCADLDALRAEVPPPEDPAVRDAVKGVSVGLARVDALNRAGRRAEALEQLGPLVEQARNIGHAPMLAEAMFKQGSILELQGKFEPAADSLRSALSLGLEHGPTRVAIGAAGELAYLYSADILQPERAEAYGDVAVSLVRRDHAGTSLEAAMVSNMSSVAYAMGDHDRANDLDRRALEIRETALGPNDPMLAPLVENLAGAALMAGRFEEAESLARRALEIWIDALGEEHPNVAISRSRLAQMVRSAGGRDKESLELLEQALAAQEAALGPEHPEIAWTLATIGEVNGELTRFDEAEAVLLRSLAIRESALGVDHPHVALSLNSLGAHHLRAAQPDKAEPLLRKALELREKALGPDHIELAPMVMNLGAVLLEQGSHEDARALFERNLRLWEESFGPDHPETLPTLMNLGRVESESGELERALEFYERALKVTEAGRGSQNPALVRPLLLIGEVKLELGDKEAGEAALVRASKLAESGNAHPQDEADVAAALAEIRKGR